MQRKRRDLLHECFLSGQAAKETKRPRGTGGKANWNEKEIPYLRGGSSLELQNSIGQVRFTSLEHTDVRP